MRNNEVNRCCGLKKNLLLFYTEKKTRGKYLRYKEKLQDGALDVRILTNKEILTNKNRRLIKIVLQN